MPKINILNEELINKIAAGEVIERPASVVKELIENSLDAKATKISVIIKDSGKKQIKIIDNGEGMDQEDAKNSIIRHATSKILTDDDLFSINTLGFRGEALASIAAVSQLSLSTKQKDKMEGYNLAIEAGKIISEGMIATEQGTVIEVNNIFFNTPARKKFLKSDQVELRHIIDVVTRYALINNNVSFKLLHDNHDLLKSPITDTILNNIASVYGIKIAKEMLEVNYFNKENMIKVTGYISKPYSARNDKSQQNFYVNNRWVKNNQINEAIYDAFHSLLFVNKHPIYILNIQVNPEDVDVNVHPTKQEIKFGQMMLVQNAVFTAIKETLEKNNLIPVLDLESEQQLSFGIPTKKEPVKEPKYKLDLDEQKLLKTPELPTEEYQSIEEKEEKKDLGKVIAEKLNVNVNVKLPPLKILGQVYKTFFIAETEGGLIIIDQHVVQERVLYEKFMNQLMNKEVAQQTLLKPEMVEFNVSEALLVKENISQLDKFGFIIEEFGENTFVLKTVPTIFGRLQPKDLLFQVIDYLKDNKNKLEEVQEEIITRMACRASVKAGDVLTVPQIQSLLNELEQTQLPYTCPHGRAVLIKITVDELEKKFKRK